MARRASGKLAFVADFNEETDTLGTGDAVARIRHYIDSSVDLPSGTADGSIDRIYATTGTATTTPTTIDVSGALTSPLAAGGVVFVDLVFIIIQNTGSGTLRYGGNAASVPIFAATNDIGIIPPGGFVVLYGGPAGWAVTGTTADILQLDTPSGTTTYKLITGGRSA